MRVVTYFLTVFCTIAMTVLCQAQEFAIIKNFQNEWKVYENGRYESFDPEHAREGTIYFLVEANTYSGNVLHIKSPESLTLFINGQLTTKASQALNLSIDSLKDIFHSPVLMVSIHQEEIHPGGVETWIQTKAKPPAAAEVIPTRYAAFRDFAIVGMLVLMIILIVIIKLNPKLTSDYFSVTKIFSVREGEDSQAYSRITSSINILFYAYSSLMLGYYLMVIFYFVPAHYETALSFQASTFWEATVKWLELSLIILGLFFLKIVMVYGLSFVFGMREIGGVHFFNWVRLLLGFFGVLTLVLFLYFITHGQREGFYIFQLSMLAWILVGCHGMINDSFGIMVPSLFQKIRDIVLANIAAGKQVFFVFVLLQYLQQILSRLQPRKDLSLADHNVLLEVV